MILEEETFKKFGYYPSDLKLHSGRIIVEACDKCGKIRETRKNDYCSLCHSCGLKGKPKSDKHKENLSKARKGTPSPRKGITLSEETKKKIREHHADFKGKNHPQYGTHPSKKAIKNRTDSQKRRYENPEERDKLALIRKKVKKNKRITKPEQIFQEICQQNNLDFHYVGDGQLWIGKNRVLNPDFIEANGKKICIEIMGDYWHSPLLNYKMQSTSNLNYRKRHYRKYKWQPIFLWETDLKRPDAKQFVLNILQKEGINVR